MYYVAWPVFRSSFKRCSKHNSWIEEQRLIWMELPFVFNVSSSWVIVHFDFLQAKKLHMHFLFWFLKGTLSLSVPSRVVLLYPFCLSLLLLFLLLCHSPAVSGAENEHRHREEHWAFKQGYPSSVSRRMWRLVTRCSRNLRTRHSQAFLIANKQILSVLFSFDIIRTHFIYSFIFYYLLEKYKLG